MKKDLLTALAMGFEWVALVLQLPSVLLFTFSSLFYKWAQNKPETPEENE